MRQVNNKNIGQYIILKWPPNCTKTLKRRFSKVIWFWTRFPKIYRAKYRGVILIKTDTSYYRWSNRITIPLNYNLIQFSAQKEPKGNRTIADLRYEGKYIISPSTLIFSPTKGYLGVYTLLIPLMYCIS